MSSHSQENEEPTSTNADIESEAGGSHNDEASQLRPPAKRQNSVAVIEISDTESDDSDICAVNTYQASADEVKRIRRAEYSSSSSSSDYSSDSESPWEDDSIVVQDKTEPKLEIAQLNIRANRMDAPKLNIAFKSDDLVDSLKLHWKEEKDMTTKDVTFTNDPFKLCLLHNVLENAEIINNIVDDMNTLDWSRKKMDLYEFHQTTDLANLTWQRSIRGIYELFKTELMSLVSAVTGLELASVSASCSLYGPGDHLLVHDDRLGDRRVAFILYLAPWVPRPRPKPKPIQNGANHSEDGVAAATAGGWREDMGGALQLLRGADVRRHVLPANNMLAFFPVGPGSFHQVLEVTSMELPRLSINGWFHGPGPEPEAPTGEAPALGRPHGEVVLLDQWVESTYMSPRARAQVAAQMECASEVCLRDFLLPAQYERLLAELPGATWRWAEPAHAGRYEVAADAGGAAGELLRLAGGAAWLRLAADCTGLALTRLATPQLQRWRGGGWRVLPAREAYAAARLEAVLYLGVPAHVLAGGATTYAAPEEAGEGALVTVPPVSNALSLVYCDAGAASFTKYVSRLTMSEDECFYMLTCTYSE
ncbi:prolyl 3-hydroxylase sudestada1 [Aricia agestis]|uniref:prolyl 3-hydroxylase sudestada1 n=1 Tax=Aricia agestis TaxID=91739 RepID=UPI001C20BF40|nr:prolyl 3-hydroxylase sudestada1 [Aricia agestis]